jgi:molybdenum cofactor cytidylyltransferase
MNKTEIGARITVSGSGTEAFRFGIVLLAAGASARMGTPKQLLEIGGQALVARAADAALASDAWPVVVVLGAHAGKIRPALARLPVLVTENPAWAEGMASSLRAGLGTLRTFSRALDGALVAVADQPAFSADAVARLVAARHESGRSIAAARYAGRLGVPALFGRQHFAALAALTGEEGARKFLAERAADTAAVELPEMATDLDTPADVAALRGPANPA